MENPLTIGVSMATIKQARIKDMPFSNDISLL